MKRTFALIYLLFAWGAGGAGDASASPQAENARQTISEWVQTQRTLSEEKTRWRQEKVVLTQSIDLLERESAQLSARLRDLQEADDQTLRERLALAAENESLMTAATDSEAIIARLETEIHALRPLFPPPLETRAASLLSRLGDTDSGNLDRRLQSVLGILNEVNRFQRTVTLSRESRGLTDGTRREVRTIYLGLAQAFFVDDRGQFAGTGRPVGDNWVWSRDDTLAAPISRAIAVLENERTPEFINLPVEVER